MSDDSVFGADAACATSVDTASITTDRQVVWDIHVANGDVTDAPAAQDFDIRFSRMHRLEEVDAFVFAPSLEKGRRIVDCSLACSQYIWWLFCCLLLCSSVGRFL